MQNDNNIIIVGAGETAEMAYEYFTHDSKYEVCAFAVERKYIKEANLCGVPVIELEKIEDLFSPSEVKLFIAVGYGKLNRQRTRLYELCKEKKYEFVSYISSKAFVWRNVEIGENCFIMENNVLQYGVKIGNNVTLWSGNHIGHQSCIRDNCFLSSHVVVSGYCEIDNNCFIGVNSTIADGISIGKDCLISAGAVILQNCEEGKIYQGNPAKASRITSFQAFNVK